MARGREVLKEDDRRIAVQLQDFHLPAVEEQGQDLEHRQDMPGKILHCRDETIKQTDRHGLKR